MLDRTVDADADPRWSCTRKKAYPDIALARKVASRINEEKGLNLVAYACTTGCGRFHVGHAR